MKEFLSFFLAVALLFIAFLDVLPFVALLDFIYSFAYAPLFFLFYLRLFSCLR